MDNSDKIILGTVLSIKLVVYELFFGIYLFTIGKIAYGFVLILFGFISLMITIIFMKIKDETSLNDRIV